MDKMIRQNYYSRARENERVFRNILKDLKQNSHRRPGGDYVPLDLNTELSLDEIFRNYSEGCRMGVFTILDFSRENDVARLSFQDVAPLSGGGAELEYLVMGDGFVKFRKCLGFWRS
jgi:hypothetical protein